MVTNVSGLNFARSIGGYDPADVARVLAQLNAELSAQETQLRKADDEFARLERKLQQLQKAKPKFSELGIAFESAINLAEEQASTLISDAQSETRSLVANANAEAKSRNQAAALAARTAVTKANREAEQIRSRAEQDAARQRQAIKDDIARVAEERAQVDRVVATVLADAESHIVDLRARTNKLVDEDLTAAQAELRRATEISARMDEEARVLSENSAIEIDSILRSAEAYATQTSAEAEEHTTLSAQRAEDVAAETEKYVAQTQERAARILEEARARSEQALVNAEKITGEITASTQEFVANMTADLEERLEKARRNLEDISGFMYSVRLLTNGFDLGELNVARSRVSNDRASNNSVTIAELLED